MARHGVAVKVRQDVEGSVMVWRGKPRQLRRVAFRYVNVGIGKAVKVRQGKVTLVSFGRGELGLKKEKR